MALFPDRRYFDRARFPAFDDLIAERDRLFAKHPKTKFILAHMGWQANDLGRLGALFDRLPNLYTEVGAILYDLGRQPRAAREFFVKYQDRILFGKDSYQPDEYPYYWRVFETNDEYFDYYRDYHAFWKLYGMGLPDDVLKKVYYGNALKIVPGLPAAGFPPSLAASRRDLCICIPRYSRPDSYGFVSRHRRRRLHRIASQRGAGPARSSRPRRRQPDHRQTPQSRSRARRGVHRRRSGRRRPSRRGR